MRTLLTCLLAAILLCGAGAAFAHSSSGKSHGKSAKESAGSDPIVGLWYTENQEGGVELYRCGPKNICGRFYWLSDDGDPTPALDKLNPDPDLQTRTLCHLKFMGNFLPDGEGHYLGGWIYSPRHGQTFNARMTLNDPDTLDVHGYVFTPMLGQSQIWKRAKTLPTCSDGQ